MINHINVIIKRLKSAAKAIKDLDSPPVDIIERATECSLPTVKGFDKENLEFTFNIRCTSEPREVQVRFSNNAAENLLETDLKVVCNCPDFRFGGVAYNAQKDDYLNQDPIQGWAKMRPVIRDPQRRKIICKHIFMVLDYIVRNRKRFEKQIQEARG